MDGFTGLNPSSAKMAIYAFEDEGKKVHDEMYAASKEFLDNVSKKWHSEHAVHFSETQIPVLYKAQEDISIGFNNTIVDAVAAYDRLDKSNGGPGLGDNHETATFVDMADNSSNMYFTGGEGFKNVGENGEVGMWLADVQTYLDIFSNQVEAVKAHLSSIPYVIDFYDPDNSLQTAYKNRITELCSELSAAVTSVSDGISEILSTEMILIAEGASAAADEMKKGQQTA